MAMQLDELIDDIHSVLKKLIVDSPNAWPPILSAVSSNPYVISWEPEGY